MNEYESKALAVQDNVPHIRETLRERLEYRKKAAQESLDNITRALKFLDDNPNFEAFHDLLGKTGF